MKNVKDKSRAVGTHWWNPPFLVPLGRSRAHRRYVGCDMSHMMDLLARRGQDAGGSEEGCARVCRQSPAARALARSGSYRRGRHLRCRHGRYGGQGEFWSPPASARSTGKCGHGRHRADPCHSPAGTCLISMQHKGRRLIWKSLLQPASSGSRSGEGFRKWSEKEQADLRKKVIDHLMDNERQGCRQDLKAATDVMFI